MNILYLDNPTAIGSDYILNAFRHLTDDGFVSATVNIVQHRFEIYDQRRDPEIEAALSAAIRKSSPDFVFSFNYYPIASTVCQQEGVRYLAWVYDSPHVALYSCTLINSCNSVFLFDSAEYERFAAQGIPTVHYLPLAASTRMLDAMLGEGTGATAGAVDLRGHEDAPVGAVDGKSAGAAPAERYCSDVSFVGGLYTEAHTFYDRMEPVIDDYARGYLQGLMQCQMQVDGTNFVEDCLSQDVVERLMAAFPANPNPDGVETSAYIYAQYMINRKITQIERPQIISQVGQFYPVDLYTRDQNFTAPGVTNHGRVDYYHEMPYVFRNSKVNLNITLRSIHKGIPLRCFDIFGAGGFLVTNFQEDLMRFFEPGVDFVYYESRQDLIDKIGYYLEHEDERREIAQHAHDVVARDHNFDVRVREMLEVSGIC